MTQLRPPWQAAPSLYVQKHDSMHHDPVRSVANDATLKGVHFEHGECVVGGACTAGLLIQRS